MAKKGNRIHVILKSTESGHSYHTTKHKKDEKMEINKYDPVARKHVVYREKK